MTGSGRVRTKRYDLEDRTLDFSREVIKFVNGLPKTLPNIEISRQLVRSAGSVGANYIEANESLSKKDLSTISKA
jgi:four helix bundle protein